MRNQVNLPVFPGDRDAFKIDAANRGISMKHLFHEIVEARKRFQEIVEARKPKVESP